VLPAAVAAGSDDEDKKHGGRKAGLRETETPEHPREGNPHVEEPP